MFFTSFWTGCRLLPVLVGAAINTSDSLQKLCITTLGICHYHLQQLKDSCQLQIDETFAITQLRLINTVSNLDLSDVRNGHGDEETGTENITASPILVSWV